MLIRLPFLLLFLLLHNMRPYLLRQWVENRHCRTLNAAEQLLCINIFVRCEDERQPEMLLCVQSQAFQCQIARAQKSQLAVSRLTQTGHSREHSLCCRLSFLCPAYTPQGRAVPCFVIRPDELIEERMPRVLCLTAFIETDDAALIRAEDGDALRIVTEIRAEPLP